MSLLAIIAATAADTSPQLVPSPDRVLIFEDHFDGPLDETVWTRYTRTWGLNSGEEAVYLADPDLIYTEDSALIIKAVREPYGEYPWRSGLVSTGGRRHFLYGRYEARMMLPVGKGTFPAWWMTGASSSGKPGWGWANYPGVAWPHSGEIDIMEHRGSSTSITSNAHYTAGNAGVVSHPVTGGVTGWHVYACEWTPDQIEFYVDDVLVRTWSTTAADSASAVPYIGVSQPFHQPFGLILNLAIGGWAGPSDETTPDPCFVHVDWVRVWGLDDERFVDVPVTGITLDRATLTLPVDYPTQGNYNKGAGIPLVPTLSTPQGKTPHDPTVYWSSSDEAVATAGGGRVIGRSSGTCTVTATTRDGGYAATCAVTVSP